MKRIGLVLMVIVMALTASRYSAELPDAEREKGDTDFLRHHPLPDTVAALLERACYDCHSMETQFPARAYFAPFDKPYSQAVKQGRGAMNFDSWSRYTPEQQNYLLNESVEQLRNHTMPVEGIFARARLTARERELLMQFLAGQAEN